VAYAATVRRGIGDVLNPSAGTALDCGLFAGGVFKPECWAYVFGNQAAIDIANPGLAPSISLRPMQGGAVPTPQQLATVPPADLPGILVAQQTAQNQADIAAENQPDLSVGSGSSIPTWVWLAVAGVGALVLMKGIR
jgi:hypothetical protein